MHEFLNILLNIICFFCGLFITACIFMHYEMGAIIFILWYICIQLVKIEMRLRFKE